MALAPNPDTPFDIDHHMTVCPRCREAFTQPRAEVVALAHLINCDRTMTNGHPYLMAQVRMVTAPLEPIDGTPILHERMLRFLKKHPMRVSTREVRLAFPDESEKQLHKVFEWLAHHGYARLSPNSNHLLRLDAYARPPLLADLTPIVDTPDLVTKVMAGEELTDAAAELLLELMKRAGTVSSKRQLKKLLRPMMPEKAPDDAINSFFNLFEVARVLRKTPDGQQWMFTRRLDAYTNPDTYRDVQFFFEHPKQHRRFKPRKLVLYEQRKKYIERGNAKPKRARARA